MGTTSRYFLICLFLSVSLSPSRSLARSLPVSLWHSPSDLHNLAFFCIISCRLYNSHLFFFFSCCLLFCFCLSPSHILFHIQAITSLRWLSSLVYVGDPWWVCVCVCVYTSRTIVSFANCMDVCAIHGISEMRWQTFDSINIFFVRPTFVRGVLQEKKRYRRERRADWMQEWRKWIFFLLVEVAITRLMTTTSTTTRKITARSYHQKQEPTTSAARIMRNEVMSDGQIIKPNFSVSLSKMDEWVGGWVWKKPHESFYPISMGTVLMHRRLDWCVDNSSLSLSLSLSLSKMMMMNKAPSSISRCRYFQHLLSRET